jgi:hypothetical protein
MKDDIRPTSQPAEQQNQRPGKQADMQMKPQSDNPSADLQK